MLVLLLLQSALQPLWLLACSTVVEYSQQEGFYRVKPPNLEEQWLEHSNSRHQASPTAETTRGEGGSMGEKFPWIFPKVATSTSLLGSFTCRKFTTWERRLYFPSEGRRADDFFARKIRQLRPCLNPRTRVPEASTHTFRPPKPLTLCWLTLRDCITLHGTKNIEDLSSLTCRK